MKLSVQHETIYRYSTPVSHTIQLLRLTPRPDSHQRVLTWQLDAPGRRQRHVDAHGNVTHTLVIDEAHSDVRIHVRGVVDVQPLSQGRIDEHATIPVQAFLVSTPLTQADGAIEAFARSTLPKGLSTVDDAMRLASAITDAVAYESGVTEVESPAAQALQLGRGVCQDHAHLFLAASRVLGRPARYVSGYIDPGETGHIASHAWADVWLNGWTSIDITHNQFASDRHVRLAVGRDYSAASPVRGVRTGGGSESMNVKVIVKPAEQ